MKYTSLHGAYYPNNYGDVLILNIEAEWLKEITGRDISLPYATDIYRDALQANRISGNRSIINSKCLLYGAGGYLGEPPSGKKLWSLRFLKNHLKPAIVANNNNIPYGIIGAGAGPITSVLGKKAVEYIANNAQIIAVRDKQSKQFLDELIDDKNKVRVTADVALSLTRNNIPNKAMEEINNEYLNFDGTKIGIHIGADRHSKSIGGNVQIIINDILKFFNEYHHLTPVLIIDNDNSVQNEAVEYIQAQLNNRCIIYRHKYIWETTALLSELDTVITNKLHVGIVNYAMGNIPISFPYHTKTKRFYKQIGKEELCIPIPEINDGEPYTLLKKVFEDINSGNKYKYLENREMLRKKALLNKEYLRDFIESNF